MEGGQAIRFDSVQLGTPDLERTAGAYATLFGRQPLRLHSGARRFQLEQGALEIEPGAAGLRSLRFTIGDNGPPGLEVLDFHGLVIFLAPVVAAGVRIGESQAGGVHERRSHEVCDTTVPADQVHALDHVVVRSTDLERAVRLWRDRLGIRLALDREFPARGLRMLFFRSAGVTLEFVSALGMAGPASVDALDGLAYQVRDLAGCRARLAGAGLEVSPLRDGQKRGTRVATLRSGTDGVPTLLIEHLDRGPTAAR